MHELIERWLTQQGIDEQFIGLASAMAGLFFITLISLLIYYITTHQVLSWVRRGVVLSKNTLDDMLLEQRVFSNLAALIPFIFLWFLIPLFIKSPSMISNTLLTITKILICFQVARTINTILNVIRESYQQTAKEKYLPLNAAVQVINLAVYLVAVILAISFVLDRSPVYLLSGLGALTAVLLLVFQDTIKGLVASIQISVNRMVAPGDWIEMPDYGADGDVLEIGLNTVKVKNFDNTVTTVPTYALISSSFKNWRDMYRSGGRRIKRSISIDVASVKFCQAEQLNQLSEIQLIEQYINDKKVEITSTDVTPDQNPINHRQLTNIGTFRAYIQAYLAQHPDVHPDMTCMVRQLPSGATGLPLELYFFSKNQNWIEYEGIQADIFDHLYAMVEVFELRIFQHPTGHDWQKINKP